MLRSQGGSRPATCPKVPGWVQGFQVPASRGTLRGSFWEPSPCAGLGLFSTNHSKVRRRPSSNGIWCFHPIFVMSGGSGVPHEQEEEVGQALMKWVPDSRLYTWHTVVPEILAAA